MEAVWLENNKLSFRKNYPLPKPLEDEALVKVRQAGICGTDLELMKDYYPFNGIPGHEFVGEIVQAPLRPQREGERVVGEINVSCGACPSCLAERQNHCEKRTILGIKDRDGAFAEYVCLPLANLITLADVISDDAAVFVEPLAAGLEIQNQIKIRTIEILMLDLKFTPSEFLLQPCRYCAKKYSPLGYRHRHRHRSVWHRGSQTPFVDCEHKDDDEDKKQSSILSIHRWTVPSLR